MPVVAFVSERDSVQKIQSAWPGIEALETASHIGILGDTHGDLEHVLTVSHTMWARGISALVVLGDFGFIWPGENWGTVLDKLSKRMRRRGQTLYFVDGNHENFDKLDLFPIGDDGLRHLRPNVIHLPRGQRATLVSGRSFAALGGANSVDRDHRAEGSSWWPAESITEADLRALGTVHADVLVGHDAPMHLPTLDTWLAETDQQWSPAGRAYSEAGRRTFHRGFMQVAPTLYLGGHYHRHIDETVTYSEGEHEFQSRIVLLDKNGSATAISQAVLDVHTLELTIFERNDSTVSELHDTYDGLWRVTTRDSIHIIDLDRWTTERLAGPDATPYSVDHPRPLRSIENCRVGERGFWTIRSHEYLIDYFWHSSSEVQRIERIERPPRPSQSSAGTQYDPQGGI